MALELRWMRPHAPYMPIATAGLLALLEEQGYAATAHWASAERAHAVLCVDVPLDEADVGALISSAPLPDEDAIDWRGGKRGKAQALKPLLESSGEPLQEFRRLVATAPPLEAALLRAILTDGALDPNGVPGRSRLLSGVKADLTSVFKRPRGITGDGLAGELRDGLNFRSDEQGLGLGLVPEVQTFGGPTGPDPSSVDAYSPLLYMLLLRGIIALPPVPVLRGFRRTVGGPLVTARDTLSWPQWSVPVSLRGLRTLFVLGGVHAEHPDFRSLRERGVDAVYRAQAVALNNMISVFRWGKRV